MKNDKMALLPQGYDDLLKDLKTRVHKARMSAVLAANAELVALYLDIWKAILERRDTEGWGTKIIERLGKDLREAFPDIKGFSPRNFRYMRQLAQICAENPILQQVVAKLPWGHTITLVEKLKADNERLWYGLQAIEHGWSRAVLQIQIETQLHARQIDALKGQQLQRPSAGVAIGHGARSSERSVYF